MTHKKTVVSLILSAILLLPTGAATVFAEETGFTEEGKSTNTDVAFSVRKIYDPATGKRTPYYSPEPTSTTGSIPRYNQAVSLANLPAAFDLRSARPTWIPAVRDQGAYGTCWAFAATAVGYASLAKAGITPQHLSPKHLAYAANGPLGFHATPSVTGSTDAMNAGGSYSRVYGAWSNYYGPELEVNYPYPSSRTGNIDSHPVTNLEEIAEAEYHLDSAVSLPSAITETGNYNPAAVTAVKQFIYENGPMSVAVDAEHADWVAWYNAKDNPINANHDVTVVGWDDNYSKSHFRPDKPSANGAWIVQNSWGSHVGAGGYYYISYQNKSIASFDYYSVAERDEFLLNQSYTTNGDLAISIGSRTGYASNVFTSDGALILMGAIVSNATAGSSYTVSVYRHVRDVPTSGQLTTAQASVGIMPMGLNTVEFDNPVHLSPGEKFAVVVRYNFGASTGAGPLLELEREYSSPTSSTITDTVSADQLIKPGQSYISTDGNYWQDVYKFGRIGQLSVGNLLLNALSDPEDVNLRLDGKQATEVPFNQTPNLHKGHVIVSFPSGKEELIPLDSYHVNVSGFDKAKIGPQSIKVELPGHQPLFYTINHVAVGKATATAIHTPVSKLYLKKNSSLAVNFFAYSSQRKTSHPITYKSSNTKVLTVNKSGKLTAKSVTKKTKVTVTAKSGGETKKITVYVVPKAKKLKTGSANIPSSLKVGKVGWATVNVGSATNVKVSFSSSKSSIVKVNKAGQLKAVKKGKAKITVKAGSKKVIKTITIK